MREVAIAILYQDNRFLLQLRDDVPNILYPGHWGFFGGHVEPGETPDTAVYRELQEEIGFDAPSLKKFKSYVTEQQIIRHVYSGPLTVNVADLILTEGLDLGLATVDDIQRGDRYSERIQQVRPIGKPHQQILLEFLRQGEAIATSEHLDGHE
jgi:8-oxo-dGTP diphosphatase